MVKNVTSLTRNGLRDWLIQRFTSLIVAAYVIFLLIFCVEHAPLSYLSWLNLFQHTGMRIFSLLALISVLLHTWVGMWTVATDYLKPTVVRLGFLLLLLLILLSCLIWGVQILWGG